MLLVSGQLIGNDIIFFVYKLCHNDIITTKLIQ